MDIRCPARKKLFAVIEPNEGTIEVRCRNKVCGYGPGIVIIHKFNINTGDLINTQRFTEPKLKNGGNVDADSHICSTVRSA